MCERTVVKVRFQQPTFCRGLDHEFEDQTRLLLPIPMCSSDSLAVVRKVIKVGSFDDKNVLEGPGEGQGQWAAGSRTEWIYLMWVEVWVEDDDSICSVEVDTNTASPRGQEVNEDI